MKEAPRPSRLNIIGRSAIAFGLLSGCAAPLAPRSPSEEFASPTKPPLEETLKTPLSFTPTATEMVEPTPTREIAPPSVPNGLRPENAATQVTENSTWVVKNKDGKTTATWNDQTDSWDYSQENIKVEQVFIGNTVDRALIEPFLGPLPPDDPTTHFIDSNTGERVGYGIGPEIHIETFGKGGQMKLPATEVFARFRGIALLDVNYRDYDSAFILEIPRTPDTATVVVMFENTKQMLLRGIPGDSSIWDQYTAIPNDFSSVNELVQAVNNQLVGHMVMFPVEHDNAPLFVDTDAYEQIKNEDTVSRIFLDYLSGASTRIPRFELHDETNGIKARYLLVPESGLIHP
jgi:hypothetical protein